MESLEPEDDDTSMYRYFPGPAITFPLSQDIIESLEKRQKATLEYVANLREKRREQNQSEIRLQAFIARMRLNKRNKTDQKNEDGENNNISNTNNKTATKGSPTSPRKAGNTPRRSFPGMTPRSEQAANNQNNGQVKGCLKKSVDLTASGEAVETAQFFTRQRTITFASEPVVNKRQSVDTNNKNLSEPITEEGSEDVDAVEAVENGTEPAAGGSNNNEDDEHSTSNKSNTAETTTPAAQAQTNKLIPLDQVKFSSEFWKTLNDLKHHDNAP